MKLKELQKLLEVGQFMYRKQQAYLTHYSTEKTLFMAELKMIKEILAMDMGILWVRGNAHYIVNTDHYEFIVEKLDEYYQDLMFIDELMGYIQALCSEEIYDFVQGGIYKKDQSTEIANRLFSLKESLQATRSKLYPIDGNNHRLLSMEKKILHIALAQLGGKRYFKHPTFLHA
ncbi:hypothetical protein [Ammoniphilus sp. YIM 78166]|uniref:hypothetical protein n=1 Tax=Ammoniphilus sp. YIM 78166 TaxID=1644106 RepID=UPI00106FB9F7|nr:hypothetical protein [Ammoniphilus sp. YIM 78166]